MYNLLFQPSIMLPRRHGPLVRALGLHTDDTVAQGSDLVLTSGLDLFPVIPDSTPSPLMMYFCKEPTGCPCQSGFLIVFLGCKDGAVVRVLASHQCGPGLIPRFGVMWVEFVAPRGLISPGTPISPLLKNQHLT